VSPLAAGLRGYGYARRPRPRWRGDPATRCTDGARRRAAGPARRRSAGQHSTRIQVAGLRLTLACGARAVLAVALGAEVMASLAVSGRTCPPTSWRADASAWPAARAPARAPSCAWAPTVRFNAAQTSSSPRPPPWDGPAEVAIHGAAHAARAYRLRCHRAPPAAPARHRPGSARGQEPPQPTRLRSRRS